MTSASVAVKRLQSESLQQKSLNELKQDAAELGLSKEDVKQFGSLTYKQTWLTAIGDAIAREFDAIETEEDIAVQPNEPPTTEPEATEIACLIDHPALAEGELREPAEGSNYIGSDDRGLPTYWALLDEDGDKVDIYSLKPSDPITPIVTIGNIGEKLLTLAEPTTTPMLDKLVQKAVNYIDNGITAQDFELLKIDPPDEYTAAIYLGWLEESEQILTEAIAA